MRIGRTCAKPTWENSAPLGGAATLRRLCAALCCEVHGTPPAQGSAGQRGEAREKPRSARRLAWISCSTCRQQRGPPAPRPRPAAPAGRPGLLLSLRFPQLSTDALLPLLQPTRSNAQQSARKAALVEGFWAFAAFSALFGPGPVSFLRWMVMAGLQVFKFEPGKHRCQLSGCSLSSVSLYLLRSAFAGSFLQSCCWASQDHRRVCYCSRIPALGLFH